MAAAESIAPDAWDSVALVDIGYLFRRNYHAMPNAEPLAAAQVTLADMARIRESVAHVIVCCDAPPYKRSEVFREYKLQREKPSAELIAQKKWLMSEMESQHYRIAKSPGYEADDCMATLADSIGVWCPDVRLVTSDKDAAQLVTSTVRMYVPAVGDRLPEIRGVEEVVAKWGVPPADMPLFQALCGDPSDGIPGIPGVGPKKAAQLIADCKSLTGIQEALVVGDEGGKPSVMWQNIGKYWDRLVLSLKLVTLERAVPLDIAAMLAPTDAQWQGEEKTATSAPDTTPDAEWDPISRAPEGYVQPPLRPVKSEPAAAAAAPTAIVKAPEDYGLVSEDLQPKDLRSARAIARWLYTGKLYPQFTTPEAVFTIIMRGKEMGINATTALAGFHLIEGKPCASADLIRSLAERDPDCEYFRLVESTATSATWETKHRKHPEPQRYTYTIDEANQAGLRSGNWQKRPRDMLAKTAGSKLARIAYPMATLGLYAPEEFEDD